MRSKGKSMTRLLTAGHKARVTEVTAKEPLRFVVMRYSSLGDVALTNPVLDLLRWSWPSCEIHVATKPAFAPAVAAHPAVTRVVPYRGFLSHLRELEALRPTMVVDLHDTLRTWALTHLLARRERGLRVLQYDKEAVGRRLIVSKLRKAPSLHTVEKYLKPLMAMGALHPRDEVSLVVHASKYGLGYARDFMERRRVPTSQLVVGMAPGARWATKRWPAERWSELASRLVESRDCMLLWFGSAEEGEGIEDIRQAMTGLPSRRGINLAGNATLEESIALLGRCDVVVSNDSGVMHLAVGRGARVVALFGSTTTDLGFAPLGREHIVVESTGLSCRPCHVHGRRWCPKGHFRCMRDLTVDLVEGALDRAIGKTRKAP
jgi:heptosyltransferase-2